MAQFVVAVKNHRICKLTGQVMQTGGTDATLAVLASDAGHRDAERAFRAAG